MAPNDSDVDDPQHSTPDSLYLEIGGVSPGDVSDLAAANLTEAVTDILREDYGVSPDYVDGLFVVEDGSVEVPGDDSRSPEDA